MLQKVKVSGGGRCNVTHNCFDPKELVKNYPRGGKALLGPFHKFSPADTVAWFERRGVKLKTEADGRMFPITDNSETIIHCLTQAAREAGVKVLTGKNVAQIEPPGNPDSYRGWQVKTQAGEVFFAEKIMVATGSSPRIWQLLEGLGHRIVPPVPSLFTFNIKDARIQDLPGVSVPRASVVFRNLGDFGKLKTIAPLLITHWGMSGPAILKLSAWGARALHEVGYRFEIEVNWLENKTLHEVATELADAKLTFAKKAVEVQCPFDLPFRLWKNLMLSLQLPPAIRWADLKKEHLQQLARELSAGVFQVNGKSTFKEEFVTAGGIDLDEVDFRRFESKIQPGLFLAGEVLDIDAVTGGFNFQAAWTGGWLAGLAMAEVGQPTFPKV